MDFGSYSEANMTAQIHETISDKLDDCAEIAAMTSFKLVDDSFVNDPFQPDPTPYYKRAKTQDRIAKEGFPKFRELPAELRSKVWGYAMPPYGVFTALMLGREKPRHQQPPPPAPIAFCKEYRLEPVPYDQQDEELRQRLGTMRAIQHTSSEAASEVQRAFPTTIDCTGGKLRFNTDHDTLACSLPDPWCLSTLGLVERIGRYDQGAIAFANDWHKVPRKLLFDGEELWAPFRSLTYSLRVPGRFYHAYERQFPQYLEGFMKFLAGCPRLRSFGFIYGRPWHEKLWDLDSPDSDFLDRVLRFCSPAPIMQDSFYHFKNVGYYEPSGLNNFMDSLEGLGVLVHGPPHGQELPNPWQGMRFGHPELQHLNFRAMLPMDSALHERMQRARE